MCYAEYTEKKSHTRCLLTEGKRRGTAPWENQKRRHRKYGPSTGKRGAELYFPENSWRHRRKKRGRKKTGLDMPPFSAGGGECVKWKKGGRRDGDASYREKRGKGKWRPTLRAQPRAEPKKISSLSNSREERKKGKGGGGSAHEWFIEHAKKGRRESIPKKRKRWIILDSREGGKGEKRGWTLGITAHNRITYLHSSTELFSRGKRESSRS